jgi:hypothetical protein
MFFMSNSLAKTFQDTVADAAYGKGDLFSMTAVLTPERYHQLLKELETKEDTLLQEMTFNKAVPVWDFGFCKVRFFRSRDIMQNTVLLIDDSSLNIITITDGKETDPMP